MVTLCYIRNETDNFSHEMRNNTTLIVQSAAEQKKQALTVLVILENWTMEYCTSKYINRYSGANKYLVNH